MKDARVVVPDCAPVDFGCELPTDVRVAIPGFGVSLQQYHGRYYRYVDDEMRFRVAGLINDVAKAAATAGASLLLLPEYFTPRNKVDSIIALAQDNEITIVAGQEPEAMIGERRLLRNEALVAIPGHSHVHTSRQFKHRASGYETPLESDGKLRTFGRTRIGTFAVIVCSDWLEIDIVSKLAQAHPALDMLLVVAANPHPELFESLAQTDAARLYCHVVVANNRISEKDPTSASAEGSLVASPLGGVETRVRRGEVVRINALNINGGEATVLLFDLPVGELARARHKPCSGNLPVPQCRRGK